MGNLLDEIVDRAWLDGARAADPLTHAAVLDVIGRDLPTDLRARYEALDRAARTLARRDAVAGAVAGASRTSPRLVVVEDLQWCSGDELPLVAGLARASQAGRVTVVATTRPDPALLADDGAWRAATAGVPMAVLDIGPLGADDAEAMVASLGGASALARRAVERAGGNPLFLEELVACAEDHLAGDALPGTIQSLVLARLDRLPPRDRAAVQIASVLGLEFSLATLRGMLDDGDYAPALLVERELLAHVGDRLAFHHALIRDGAYASLPRARKRELHGRAAGLLGASDPVLRARHLDAAEDPAAAGAYLDAARVEADARRPEAALSLLDRARALAGDDLRCAVELARGERLLDLSAPRDAVDAYSAAANAATSAADRGRAAIGEAAAHRALSAYEPALRALADAERALADKHADTDESRAQIHYHRAALYFAMGRNEASWDEARRARDFADRTGDPALRARALSSLGDAEYATGSIVDAQAAFARTIALCDANHLTRFSIANRVMLGQSHMWLARMDRALGDTRRALADALDVRFRFGEMFARHSTALIHQFAGDLDAARAELVTALDISRELGSSRFECEFLTQLAEIDHIAGRAPLAEIRHCVDLTLQRGVVEYCGPWTYGVLAVITDDAGERRAAIADGQALLDRGSMRPNFVFFHRLVALACKAAGDRAGAHHHARACLAAIDAYRAVLFRDEVAPLATA
jgi:tetratricopeptide (TPR) repeat protein